MNLKQRSRLPIAACWVTVFCALAVWGVHPLTAAAAAVAALPQVQNSDRPGSQKNSNSGQELETDRSIRVVLASQVNAWNEGDIDRFMTGYWKSDKLSFVSDDRLLRGWQATIDRYKSRYATREAMGILAFENLEITVLGPQSAYALGTWQLKRSDDKPHGRFTLIFRKFEDGWKIVHDHTSSAPLDENADDDS